MPASTLPRRGQHRSPNALFVEVKSFATQERRKRHSHAERGNEIFVVCSISRFAHRMSKPQFIASRLMPIACNSHFQVCSSARDVREKSPVVRTTYNAQHIQHSNSYQYTQFHYFNLTACYRSVRSRGVEPFLARPATLPSWAEPHLRRHFPCGCELSTFLPYCSSRSRARTPVLSTRMAISILARRSRAICQSPSICVIPSAAMVWGCASSPASSWRRAGPTNQP